MIWKFDKLKWELKNGFYYVEGSKGFWYYFFEMKLNDWNDEIWGEVGFWYIFCGLG